MTTTAVLLRAILIAGLAVTPALAQDADEPAGPLDGLSLGEEIDESDAPGSTYTAETFGDWQMRCVRNPEGDDPCQLYQLLVDEEGNSVAEISLFGLEPGQQAAAGATIVTPLETLLTQQITMRVDDGQAKRYPFTWCNQIGCFARVGFTADEIAAFRRGAAATLTIVPATAPDVTVDLTMSLMGFTAGYDAVNEANGI